MEEKFRCYISEPLNPTIIDKGEFSPEGIIQIFQKFPWNKYLLELDHAKGKDIYCSPSLSFESKLNKNKFTASAVGGSKDLEFYLFYKRPKKKSILFGLIQTMDENYMSDLMGQTKKDVMDCLNALAIGDSHFLEHKFK